MIQATQAKTDHFLFHHIHLAAPTHFIYLFNNIKDICKETTNNKQPSLKYPKTLTPIKLAPHQQARPITPMSATIKYSPFYMSYFK